MKTRLFLFTLFFVLANGVLGQGRPPVDPLLAELLNQNDVVLLTEKLQKLAKSKKEKELSLLLSYYTAKQNSQKVDEVTKLIASYFPLSEPSFLAALGEIYNEKNPVVADELYKSFNRFTANPALSGHRYFDFAKYYVAITFLGKNNPDKVMTYLNSIQDTTYKTNAFSYAAREATAAGDYVLGETLIRKTLGDITRRGNPPSRDYSTYAAIAAKLFFLNGKYEEGFQYAKDSYQANPQLADTKATYLDYLVVNGRFAEAYPMMEASIREGNASLVVKTAFKTAYIAVKGSDAGFTTVEKSLYANLRETIKADLIKKMVNEPAFNFTLKDLEGKSVSLSDFKGKVVVLDFWATWCGPCKAAFPNMQEAVTRYKDDAEVVFLFIHTWETSPDPAKDAGNYIKDQKYTFNVLMDTKDAATKINPAAAGYKFKGIPAKFIIDKTGNTRFSTLGGGSGGQDAFLEEMNTMIELAKKG